MTTYNFTGFGLIESFDTATGAGTGRILQGVTLQIVMPDGDNALSYTSRPDFFSILSSELLDLRVVQSDAPFGGNLVAIRQVVWTEGTTFVLSLGRTTVENGVDTEESYAFAMGGATLPLFTNVAQLDAFEENQVRDEGPIASGPFAPGTNIVLPSLASFAGTTENDLVEDGNSGRLIATGAGNDRILGNGGNDTLRGGDGLDTLNGGSGDDFIFGGDTPADLRDVVFAGAGNDSVDAGYGNDQIFGEDGNDKIEGGFGADEVNGQGGDDVLGGGALGDVISGGAGRDFINGGFGFDRLNGGAGGDLFFHAGVSGHGSDWIQDYNAAEGDLLVAGLAGATRSQFQVNLTTTPGAGAAGVQEAFVIYRPTGQIIWALVDGAGQTDINLQIGAQVFDLMG